MKNKVKGSGHLKTGYLPTKTSKHVGFGGPWYLVNTTNKVCFDLSLQTHKLVNQIAWFSIVQRHVVNNSTNYQTQFFVSQPKSYPFPKRTASCTPEALMLERAHLLGPLVPWPQGLRQGNCYFSWLRVPVSTWNSWVPLWPWVPLKNSAMLPPRRLWRRPSENEVVERTIGLNSQSKFLRKHGPRNWTPSTSRKGWI